MNENIYEVVRDDDENARDEFSAAHIFKKRQNENGFSGTAIIKRSTHILRDLTNNGFSNKLNLKSTLTNKISLLNVKNVPKSIGTEHNFNCKDNSEDKKLENNYGVKRNSKDHSINDDDTICLRNLEDDTSNYAIPSKRCKRSEFSNNPQRIEPVFKDFDESSHQLFAGCISHALTIPANGLNNRYKNAIVVAAASPNSIVRVREGCVSWLTMKETSKIEKRILLTSSRKFCSPREQFVVTDGNQYQSKCLIDSYLSNYSIDGSFNSIFGLDGINHCIRKFHHSNSLMAGNINTSHFHDLYLEKLPCNNNYDFMPTSKQLTGSILGGFVNDVFELSKCVFLPSEVIHVAVDMIYQYLSRVHDVPLVDMRWITLGAVWIAAKNDGLNIMDHIKDFADCRNSDLQQAELRMFHVIDFNVTKPHAINFRNRFLLIEQANSTILHLSSFILDMTLHCYTLMLKPASKRAAAAVWLARLIDKFTDVRFNEEVWGNIKAAAEKMDSVWPDHFAKLTGYSHRDIAKLALQMHVIIIAFITSDEYPSTNQNIIHPSVSACHEKYSSIRYGELTTSYEKFTARTVYYAGELYCLLNNLQLSHWMEKNEYETLLQAFNENRLSKLRRSTSCFTQEIYNQTNTSSCPEIISRPMTNSKPHKSVIKKDYNLLPKDSGYSTAENEFI